MESWIKETKLWWDGAPWWKWFIAPLILLPVLVYVGIELFARRVVVVDPTAAMDQRHEDEENRKTKEIEVLDKKHDAAMADIRTSVEEDRKHDITEAADTVPGLRRAKPGALAAAMKKIDSGDPL